MAQKLQTIAIKATGFSGLNTEDSPVTLDPSFAEKAENAIIDKFGRIGARKGVIPISTTGFTVFNKKPVKSLFEFISYDGVKTVVSTGNNKIVTGDISLVDQTPAGVTITDDNWKIVSLANKCYMFQREHEPLIMTLGEGSAITVEKLDGSSHSNGTPPQANEVIAAYGKLWAADVAENKRTIYWSDTLLGGNWSGGSSGSLDLTNVFPNGYDEIVALSAHNGFLVIFCRNSIIIYEGAETPNDVAFKLHDVIEGIGCIERDSVQNIGTDVLFLSNEGVRSLGRTIQEKSSPVGNISKNVRTELMQAALQSKGKVKSVYSPQDAFYLLSFPEQDILYCFDLKNPLPDGSAKATTWNTITPYSFAVLSDDSLYFGIKAIVNPFSGVEHDSGIFKYGGYVDGYDLSPDGSGHFQAYHYLFKYESTAMDFGLSSNLKFLKKLEATVVGNVGAQSGLVWYWDYDRNFLNNFSYFPAESEPNSGEFNVSEYNTTAEYTTGVYIQTPSANASGNGKVLQIGIHAFVLGAPYSIQSIDTSVLLGRTK